MMGEWSQLPRELIDLISKQLESEIDLIRYRSVCSSWRSSVSALHPRPSRFPILPNDGISNTTTTTSTWGFYLSKRTIFLLGLPEPYRRQTSPSSDGDGGWIIKLEQDVPQRLHLLNPLSRFEFKPLPTSFPRILDSSNFRITELGHEYILQYINYRRTANSISDAGNLYMEKVALRATSCSSSQQNDIHGFVLLTIHVSGKLAILKSGDKKWNIINDLPSPYDDVMLFAGHFYAVDCTGRTVVVVDDDSDPSVRLVANSVFGGDKKFLVESCGDLLLVDMYSSVGPEDDLGYNEGLEFYEEFDCFMTERTVRFKVFKLDRDDQKWVEMESLGDRMLFLGDNCTFSASCSDFPGCEGNCIFFTDHFFYSNREEDGVMKGRSIGVFSLGNGSIGPLSSYPGNSKLFWPPPEWVSSTMLGMGLDQLRI